jgi:hypothetical protein
LELTIKPKAAAEAFASRTLNKSSAKVRISTKSSLSLPTLSSATSLVQGQRVRVEFFCFYFDPVPVDVGNGGQVS